MVERSGRSWQDGVVNHNRVVSIRPRSRREFEPRFVSLFSGCGGLDIGFRWAGFKPVWSNDLDYWAVETYRKLLPGHPAVCADIDEVRERPSRGDAEVVIGGPPCQGFSVAGRMDPEDPRSRHVWTFLKVVQEIEPQAFVMENVKSLATASRWADLRSELLRTAKKLGFDTHLFVCNAADFGVPQLRERMFMVGIRHGYGDFIYPATTTSSCRPTVRQSLSDLPEIGSPGNDSVCVAKITPAKLPVLRKSPWAGMLFNGAGRPMDLDRPAPTLPASMGGNRTPIIDQRQLEAAGKSWVVRYHSELSRGRQPRKRVPPWLRRISVEEAAAIQSFPAGIEWCGPVSARYRQIGNAVPPELAFCVAKSVRSSLYGHTDSKVA